MVEFIMNESIKEQFEAFSNGFKKVVDKRFFSWFSSEEIEMVICGERELDFKALEYSTKYDSGYNNSHRIILELWQIIHNFNIEEKRKFLSFVTGSDRSPIGGLGNVHLVIVRHGEDSDRLPQAHTCYNVLLLPEYNNKNKLEERLRTAINNSEGFGMF